MKKNQELENPNKKKRDLSGLFELIPFFKPYKRDVIFAVLALLITAIMILFFGKAIKYLIDFGFVKEDEFFLNVTLLIFIAAVIVLALAGYFRSFLINSVAERVIADLRKKVYDHIIRVSAEYFELTKTGDVISRLTVDTVVLYNVISSTISFFIRNILLFIGGVCFLFLTSVKLSLISFMIIPVSIAPIILMGRSIKELSHKAQVALASVGSHVEESINGVKTIQAYLCEKKEIRNFSSFVDYALEVSLKKIKIKSLLIALVITLAFGGIAVVLWFGGREVLSGRMTSGDLSSFIFYSVITAISLVSLSQIAGQIQSASAASSRIFEILKINSPVQEPKNPEEFKSQKDFKITFQKVAFSYPSRRDVEVLKNFSLNIQPREKIAIVGSSGSGKTTILQLLLRFYDVDAGMISINNHDTKSLSFYDLRKNFSYISQDCFIFSGTVFENIAYVDKSITKKDVEDLIAKTPALNFINHLPKKLDSFVGEKGIKLSGGERQRIAIARAILKDSPVLLLDEATASLDNQNEQSVNQVILDLAKDKTVITIAHKLSSVVLSDRIIFLKDGEVVEEGSHQKLMAKDGFYKKMYEIELLGVD